MVDDQRFHDAIKRFDELNSHDPRTDRVDGLAQPRERLFAQRVYECVKRLDANPSESLLLAARAHTVERWKISRDEYPKTNVGYHEWRDACAQHHAHVAAKVLRELDYPAETIQIVRNLITRKNWPADADARTLEDADCIVFLQHKLKNYVDQWDDDKTVRILRSTLKKMTGAAREWAMTLEISQRESELLRRAMV